MLFLLLLNILIIRRIFIVLIIISILESRFDLNLNLQTNGNLWFIKQNKTYCT